MAENPKKRKVRPSVPAIDRVLNKVEVITETGCWIFMGALNDAGYGIVGLGGRGAGNDRAHRITYRHFKGEIPDSMFVCHRCDTPSCCNPEHLFLGSNQDNVNDMRAKQRHAHGEQAPYARLVESQIKEIRKSTLSESQLGAKYNISPAMAGLIRRGQRWSHVED